nr:UDP-N-acetylenolpyruvoylglucosamine reductase [Lachnospiraceae bacterium]
MVSQKHAGFVVNAKDATASDIYTLIKAIQKIVKDRFDVELEPEVKMIGEFRGEE